MMRPPLSTDEVTLQEGDLHCEADELPRRVRQLAERLIAEGDEAGEDRRSWELDVHGPDGTMVMTITLAEALEGNGLARLH